MPNYDVVVKLITATPSSVEDEVRNYINSVDSSKTIRAITAVPVGTDYIYVLIVHDA